MFFLKKLISPWKKASKGKSGAKSTGISRLVFLAGRAIGLCGVSFGLLELRTNLRLASDVEDFKEKRIELIEHIKRRNREIATLRSVIDSIRECSGMAASRKKNTATVAAGHIPLLAAGPTGLPLSFDNGTNTEKVVALTFDGGSLDNAAGAILDTLRSRNVKATVFVTGRFIVSYPDDIRRLVAEGHEVGNHTFSHAHLTSWATSHTQTTLSTVSQAFLCRELFLTDSLLLSVTGRHCSHVWRAPFGEKNREICLWAQGCGYIHTGWGQGKIWRLNLDSNDWIPDEETPGYHTPEEVLDKILVLSRNEPYGINGGIILMHLGTVRKDPRSQIYRILGTLIDSLIQQGYSFVTVSEMMKKSGIDVSQLQNESREPFQGKILTNGH
jgi:peptidoglycan/xylan/chitin deacetylase (PgdA/CDA1 family)